MKPFVFFITIATVLFMVNLQAQSLIKCKDNIAYWVIPDHDLYYAILLKGDIDLSNNSEIININDTALQYILLDKPDYNAIENNDVSLLLNYVCTEQGHLRKIYDSPSLTIKSETISLPVSGKAGVFWYFDLPKGKNKEVTAQLFINIIIRNRLFGLSTPLFKDYDFNVAKTLLINAVDSLDIVKNPKSLCYQ